jgi:type IV pilus assembly protein PilC
LGVPYKYRAVQANGQIIEGKIDANSKDDAISILKSRHQSPIQITEDKHSISINLPLTEKKVKVSDLATFCKQLSAMLNTGMPINRALDIQEAQTANVALRGALKSVSQSLKQGALLSKSMKEFPKVFPKILVTMVEAGEATGKLDEVLERMSLHYTKENKINNRVKGALTYPTILGVMTVGAVVVLMVFILPTFKDLFNGMNMELPLITRMVMGLSDIMQKFWYIFLAAAIGGFVSIKSYLATDRGRYNYDHFLLSSRILREPMTQIVTARFTRTMSTLMQSGISVVNALAISGETTNNVIVTKAISVASDGVKRGLTLTGELKKTGLFPQMMVSMLGIGEETGTIDELLLKTADYYDEEFDAGVSRLLSLIEPAMILIMGVVIGGVVMSVMIPMFTMSSSPDMFQ